LFVGGVFKIVGTFYYFFLDNTMNVLPQVLSVFIFWFTIVVSAVVWYFFRVLFLSFLFIDYVLRLITEALDLMDTLTPDEAFEAGTVVFEDRPADFLVDRQLDFFIWFDLLVACWIFEFKIVRQLLLASCFLVPFSSLAGAALSNEYLLFCCLIYAVFVLYGSLSGLLSTALSAPIAGLRAAVSKKQMLLFEVLTYRLALQTQYHLAVAALDELVAEIPAADSEYDEVANVIFEQTLLESAYESLSQSLSDELTDGTLEEYVEFDEQDQESLEELLVAYLEDSDE
jgi:hypothetical protein